ncbi:MAG: hypothetical protein ACK5PQ_00925 [Alphaproteobacteria bacterium]
MNISSFIFLFITVCMSTEMMAAQGRVSKARYGAPASLSDNDFGAEEVYGNENFQDDFVDDMPPPKGGRPTAQPKMSSRNDYEEENFEDDLGEGTAPSLARDSFVPADPVRLPSGRPGFQQKMDMKGPQRIAAMVEDPYGKQNLSGIPPQPEVPPMAAEAQFPPRDYPPKLPHLKMGQTEWNRMDLHSLVADRKE